LAKGANVDKLAAEFADELDALGVRVAALEKKSDNVKITGAIRYHWTNGKVGDAHKTSSQLRTRLTFTGTVNDNWKYVGMIENRQVFQDATYKSMNHVGEDGKTQFQRAYLEGRLGGVNVTAGRFNLGLGHSEDDIYSSRFDGVKVGYGNKVRLSGYYGKPSNFTWQDADFLDADPDNSHDKGYDKGYGVLLEGDLGKNVTLWAGYDKFEANPDSIKPSTGKARHSDDNAIWNVGAEFKFKDVSLAGTYAKSDANDVTKDNGFYIDLKYKGAQASKPGSWGLQAKYYHWGDGVTLQGSHGWDNFFYNGKGGWKGYKLAADYTVAKNMIATVAYWDLKDRVAGADGNKVKSKTLWTALNVRF